VARVPAPSAVAFDRHVSPHPLSAAECVRICRGNSVEYAVKIDKTSNEASTFAAQSAGGFLPDVDQLDAGGRCRARRAHPHKVISLTRLP
jgi:hypothetical protein